MIDDWLIHPNNFIEYTQTFPGDIICNSKIYKYMHKVRKKSRTITEKFLSSMCVWIYVFVFFLAAVCLYFNSHTHKKSFYSFFPWHMHRTKKTICICTHFEWLFLSFVLVRVSGTFNSIIKNRTRSNEVRETFFSSIF